MGYPYYTNEILIDRPDAESLDYEWTEDWVGQGSISKNHQLYIENLIELWAIQKGKKINI